MQPSASTIPEGSRFVAANGTDIHLLEVGDGRPLLLLHGAMGTAKDNFSDVIAKLSPHFRVIAPDTRGHGRTRNSETRLSYSLMADDVASLIHELNLHRPFVCGWSDGGQIALDLAIRFPDLPGALAVGGAYIRFSDQYLASARAIGLDGPGEVDFAKLSHTIPEVANHWRDLHANQGSTYWKDLFLALSHAAMSSLPYAEADLTTIAAPTFIFLGDRDQFIPVEQAVEMYRLIPQSQLAIIRNADHSLRTDTPKFSQLLLEFFQDQANPG